ncbi:large subunit ribosomal protein L27Ae [Nematocida homosporus]|uniref:large subunit ribosomal protein L27Ae n=1 Tax=Nematocida homosporus TaxID=1912981 RepID=UPI00222055AA|nr:large subunit ribosomal protein L27Ae [Nematocida homosporus]KAI5187945.1 large subunit ribosomal protein L27Ae [Nematocida homosporus]
MLNRVKKCRKLRGHVSHGHGRVGKHRKHPGGRGKAGGLTHHRTLFERYHPDYFGKRGMCVFFERKNKQYMPIISVDKLWSLVDKAGAFDEAVADQTKVPVLNLPDFGYFKVVGSGNKPIMPIVVKARQFTPEAERKIVEAGGQCVLTV